MRSLILHFASTKIYTRSGTARYNTFYRRFTISVFNYYTKQRKTDECLHPSPYLCDSADKFGQYQYFKRVIVFCTISTVKLTSFLSYKIQTNFKRRTISVLLFFFLY